MSSKLVKIGKVIEPRALHGDFKIRLFSGEAPWINSLKRIFLKLEKEPVEHDIISLALKGSTLIARSKEIKNRTDAEKWVGAEVFISEDFFQSSAGETIYLREILDFLVLNNDSEVGKIIGFEFNGSQDLLIIQSKGKQKMLVPLVKDFIVKIDQGLKTVTMVLPPGLLEVNKSNDV